MPKVTQLMRGRWALKFGFVHCQSQDSVHQVTVLESQTFTENLLCANPGATTIINVQMSEEWVALAFQRHSFSLGGDANMMNSIPKQTAVKCCL